jgi:hypothetical protein
MNKTWTRIAVAGSLGLLAVCVQLFCTSIEEGEGHRACQQAAVNTVMAGQIQKWPSMEALLQFSVIHRVNHFVITPDRSGQ